jgi:hypothetical protein
MTSNIGIFGYLGSRDWAACWIRHWVDQRELNRPRSFYPFFLYFFFYLFIARGVLFGISKTSFQQRILASLGDIYDGRAFGLDWHRSGRIRLGGFLLESIHFFWQYYHGFYFSMAPRLQLLHPARILKGFDQEIARRKHGR